MLRSVLLGGVSALVMIASGSVAALSPAPADQEGTFTMTATLKAARNLPKSDTGAFSNYKADRTLNVTCDMQANPAGGVGPDGMTAEQKSAEADAIAAGRRAEANVNAAGAPQDAAALQREIAACGNDQACQMRVAMQMMNDPRMQNVQQSAIEAGRTMRGPSDRLEAMVAEPVWQRWSEKVDSESCTGKITFDDFEDFDRGFVAAGRGTSPGTRTVTGTADAGGIHPELWFNLKDGKRQFTIPIATYAGDANIQDTYSGNTVESMSLVSGIGRMPNELLKIGPEGAASMGGTGSKTFTIDPAKTSGWSGTLTVSWNFKP
jgi:hypothetical protein